MGRTTWLHRLINRIENNKEAIHFLGMILTLVLAGIAGVWAFIVYQDPQLGGILDIIASPFVIGFLNFSLVFFLGSLIVTTISLTRARRMKAFNMEIEFEAREHKEIKVGQAHYLSGILGNYDAFIGQFIDRDNFNYRDILEAICHHYREYFTSSYDRNLSYKIRSNKDKNFSRSEKQLLFYLQSKNEEVTFQNRFINNNSLLIGLATTMVPEEELVLSFHIDDNYEFDEFDVEAVRALIKYGDIVLQHLYFI